MRLLRVALALALSLAGGSCASPPPDVPSGPATLSEWGLFADMSRQIPAADVIPYDVIAPLFSDYATKHRFMRLPPGGQITIDAEGNLVFPEQTVIVKTFGFLADLRDPTSAERLIETRLLVREGGRWVQLIYVYDDDMREARLFQYGRRVPVSWTNASGMPVSITYRVPNAIECSNCHGGNDPISLLGVRVRQLDRTHDYGSGPENQIDHLAAMGLLVSPPAEADRHPLVDPFGTADIDARARSYLEANCAHCHRDQGAATQSGLWLGIGEPEDGTIGICKTPAAAGQGGGGRPVDVYPGHPELSIMIYRVGSEEPGIKMPELPTVLHHEEGLQLLTQWIQQLPGPPCP